MKILTISDVHGRDDWKKEVYENGNFLAGKKFDKVVFLGDYLDSFDKSNSEIYINFKEIIELKKKYPNDIILLIGNHEMSYMDPFYRCSGYRPEMSFFVKRLLDSNIELFQLAYQVGNHLWSHAGVHKGWWEYYAQPIIEGKIEKRYTPFFVNCDNIADQLNLMFEFKEPILFMVGHDRGGTSKVGGPLWIDKGTLYRKGLEGYHQIVGHSPVRAIKNFDFSDGTSLTFTDCLNEDFYYLEI